jgi:threonine dehydratase
MTADPMNGDDRPLPTPHDVLAAANRLSGIANRTPAVTSRTVDRMTGASVVFKCENLQRAGAFKFRGAHYALSRLSPEQQARGALCFSSGNHAQATALAGQLLGIPIVAVMPADAPRVKLEATRQYGAEVVIYDREREDREAIGARLGAERGLAVIPPYNHPDVIAGQGTAALELFADAGPLDVLLVCCGGGGLLSGCALAAKAVAPACHVVGVEPALADDATRSFRTGVLQTVHNPPTIADGARTPSLGTLTFPLVRRYVHDMVTVSDDALVSAMRVVWERLKLIVEPTGALAAAALLEAAVPVTGRRVGVILSGGNVDVVQAAHWFEHGPRHPGHGATV